MNVDEQNPLLRESERAMWFLSVFTGASWCRLLSIRNSSKLYGAYILLGATCLGVLPRLETPYTALHTWLVYSQLGMASH